MEDKQTYRTFKRSARNFIEFVNAKKITVHKGLTEAEAQAACAQFNNNRTPEQIRKGTKLEYTKE